MEGDCSQTVFNVYVCENTIKETHIFSYLIVNLEFLTNY